MKEFQTEDDILNIELLLGSRPVEAFEMVNVMQFTSETPFHEETEFPIRLKYRKQTNNEFLRRLIL